MIKTILVAVILIIPQVSVSKENTAANFINDVKTSADSGKQTTAAIQIECPAESGSGKLVISKASYNFEESIGVFVFKNSNSSAAKLTALALDFPNGDFTSDVITGMSFTFKMPGGQFFVDVFKKGNPRVGVNKNEASSIQWITCKTVESS